VFASLSIFLHISHVKLALKISASTSMCSNAGFMLAFCPRRLFNIIIFMQKSTTFFSTTQRKIFFLLFFFEVWTWATPNFGQLFSGQPKKLAEIGQFFFYSLPKKQKIPPSKVVQFYKTFIFALEVLRIKRRIYP